MYNFKSREEYIKGEGRKYGVQIVLVENKLQFGTEEHGSESVEKYLARIMDTYNKHVDQGF